MNLVGSYLNRWSILGLFFVFGSMTFRSLYNCTLKTGTRLQIVFFLVEISQPRQALKAGSQIFSCFLGVKDFRFVLHNMAVMEAMPHQVSFQKYICSFFFHNSKSAKSLCLEFPLSVRLKLAVNSPSHQIKHWRRMQTARRVLHFLTNMSFKNVHSCGCVFKHCVNFMANGRLSP